MSDRRTFVRKIIYLGVIVALLVVLSWLSPPATRDVQGTGGSRGGKLAQLRAEYGLSQASLGEIDPTSEAIKLATLGMRGVAANILWNKAQHYQKVRNWTALSATLEQIIKLQPNFVSVWRFQGWNLAYNVSADWDDYRDRYYWVKRGINFIREGTRYNENEPILMWDNGWFIAQKIGRADERREFRQLFREDDEFHGSRPVSQRDNWLVGKESFREAERIHDRMGVPIKGMTPLLFRSDAPKCQINYAMGLEEDGVFGERAKFAWNQAAEEWEQYGTRDIPALDGTLYRLEDLKKNLEEHNQLLQELMDLSPGLRAQMLLERKERLSPAERAVIDKPPAERTAQERTLADSIFYKVEVPPAEIASRMTGDAKPRAEALAKRIDQAAAAVRNIETSMGIVLYPYWKERCQAERTDAALEARQHLFEGDRAFREADLQRARSEYLAGFEQWRKVIDQFARMLEDGVTGEEVIDAIRRYEQCLKQLDESKPEPFVLQPLIDAQKQYYITSR